MKTRNDRLHNDPQPAPEPAEEERRRALLLMLEDLEEDRRKIEQARREWTQAFDAIRDPVFIHDSDYRIVRANRAYAERAGGGFAAILGRPYWEVFPRRSGPLPLCRIATEDGQDGITEEFALDTGETFVSRAFVIRDADKRFLYAVHMLEDVTERRRAEAEQRILSEALRQAAEAVVVLDRDLCIDYVNPAFLRIFGYAPEDVLGKPVSMLTVTSREDAVPPPEVVRRVRETGHWSGETWRLASDGNAIPVLLTAAAIHDARNEIVGYVGMHLDLRDIKRATAVLRESEQKFRALIEDASDITAVLDTDGVIRYQSPSTERLLGYGKEELLGRSAFDLIHPEDSARARQALSRSLEHPGEVQTVETRLHHRDGSWRHFEVVGRYLPQVPSIAGIVIDARDITARKQAEEEVHKERDTAQRYLDIVGVMLVALDSGGKVSLINRKGCELLGYSEEEIIGQSWFDRFLPEGQRQDTRKVFGQALMGETQLTEFYENPVLTRNGTERFIAWHNRTLTNEAGKIVGTLSSGEDITERKQAEAALLRANRALKTLSACNAALVHAQSEPELLQQVCRIIADTGGYHYVWIGFAERDEGRRIRPVAQAGFESDFFAQLALTWADNEAGRLPAAVAIREGAATVVHDVSREASLAFWHPLLARLDVNALCAFPLVQDGETFGTLSICSRERDAFDRDEMMLLAELAEDLNFGILSLRTREQRDRAMVAEQRSLQQLRNSLEATIGAVATTVEMRDPYTAGHERRVATLASAIARELGLPPDRIEGIHFGSLIHDLGKIKIPAEILSKPMKLTPVEFELVKEHAQAGYDILKGVEFPWPVAEMALQHHEHVDGSGYPQGLKGEQMLLESRILAVADIVEAMSSHRPYRPAHGIEAALAEIERHRGTYYDSSVVEMCLRLFREGRFTFAS